jgi:hypothetical protein
VVRAYTNAADGKYRAVRLREFDAKTDAAHYHGRDTFFVHQNYLIRRYPYYEKQTDSLPQGTWWQSYQIRGGIFVLAKEQGVL